MNISSYRSATCVLTVVALGLLWPAVSLRAHDDFSPRAVSGKVVVGYYNDGFVDVDPADGLDDNDGRPVSGIPETPVFGYDVALDYDLSLLIDNTPSADDHYLSSEDPGVNSPAGLLPSNRTLTSDLLSFNVLGYAGAANLFYWDGSGTIGAGSFAPASSVTLKLELVNNRTVDGTNTVVSGFIWGTTDAGDGHLHGHATTIIDDVANPQALPDPPAGVYLIGMEFMMSGLTTSDPVWMVYAAGVDEEVHDDAIAWLEEHLPTIGKIGDLNDDGFVDSHDIDTLWNVIRPELAGGDDPGNDDEEDLNGDGFVNEDDVDYLLANLLTAGTNRQYGDADLDGGVGGLDYTAWRQRAGTGWANGDFDGDGGVGGLDYTLWRTRPTTYPTTVGPHAGSIESSIVPEPTSLALLVLSLPVFALLARRRR